MSDRFLPGIHEPAKAKSKSWIAWLVLGVLVLALVVFTAVVNGSKQDDDPYDPNNRLEAISQCEARIEDQLKSPTTADFDSTASGNVTWTVKGTVDAENSFGAMIRSEYQCTVKVTGENTLSTRIDYFD